MSESPEAPPPFDDGDERDIPPMWADDAPSGGDSGYEESRVVPPLTFSERLRRWLFPSFAERDARITEQLVELGEAIDLYPETPTNYVLRGEYYLQIRYNELAEKDFLRAVKLATEAVERNNWGLIAQSVQDRAVHGLQLARKRK